MVTKPGALNTTNVTSEPTSTETATPSVNHASPAVSTRARWTMTSIAGVGLLGIGLLGGMLIGQQMGALGPLNDAGPARMSAEQNSYGHHAQTPEQVRDHLKERMTGRWDKRRDQQSGPGKSGEVSPPLNNSTPNNPAPSESVPSVPEPNNG